MTRELEIYLSPKMMPMAIFGLICLAILFVFQQKQIINEKAREQSKLRVSYILFMIPIIFFFSATPDSETINTLPNKSVDISYAEQSESMMDVDEQNMQEDENTEIKSQDVKQVVISDINELPPCVLTDEVRSSTEDSDFRKYLYYSIEKITSETVTMLGFVYKDESFPENTIILARQVISCCAADATISGYFVKVDNADELNENQWIEVKGTIAAIELEMYGSTRLYPVITDGKVIKCAAPSSKSAYIYP